MREIQVYLLPNHSRQFQTCQDFPEEKFLPDYKAYHTEACMVLQLSPLFMLSTI